MSRIVVPTDVLAAQLECTTAHIRYLKQRGIIIPVGTAPRRGAGGRPSDLWDLALVLDTLKPDRSGVTPDGDLRWDADGPRVPAPGSSPLAGR